MIRPGTDGTLTLEFTRDADLTRSEVRVRGASRDGAPRSRLTTT